MIAGFLFLLYFLFVIGALMFASGAFDKED